jgi:hypothetical protein
VPVMLHLRAVRMRVAVQRSPRNVCVATITVWLSVLFAAGGMASSKADSPATSLPTVTGTKDGRGDDGVEPTPRDRTVFRVKSSTYAAAVSRRTPL